MKAIGLFLRLLAKLRFRVLGLATIKDIPTDRYNSIIEELLSSGWKRTYFYDGVDAGIDYGKVKLKKNGTKLTFEWDNWSEGSIEGPAQFIQDFANVRGMKVTPEWRWAEYG